MSFNDINIPNSDDTERRTSSSTFNADADVTFSFDLPRRIIRNSSFILADTGERIRRTLSIHDRVSSRITETSYLLPTHNTQSSGQMGLKGWLLDRERSIAYTLSSFYKFLNEPASRSVLKCSLAYFVASLGVYCTPLSEMLGRSDSKHVVATVAVYFHPSRTKGSMHQSLVFVVIAILFGFSTSFLCRLASTFFFQRGESEISYAIDLAVSSIALAVIAYMKQKVGKPTFNTACSLATISIVSCIVKEGSLNSSTIPYQRLQSILYIVCVGCFISVMMCYIIWPTSAIENLRKNLNDSYNIMSSILSVISSKFFIGENVGSADVNDLFTKLEKNISSLNESLEEAKYELKIIGKEDEFELLAKLVNSTKSLSRHLLGLRSSAEMQWKLLHEEKSDTSSVNSFASSSYHASHSSRSIEDISRAKSNTTLDNVESEIAVNPSQLFDLFVYHLAPSTKSLIYTINGVLKQLPFEHGPNSPVTQTRKFQTSLTRASDLYKDHQTAAFRKLYSQKIFKNNAQFNFRADQEEVAASCGNFASLLGQFSKDLMGFLILLEEYPEMESKPRTFKWLKFWTWRSGIIESEDENTLDGALVGLQKPTRAVENSSSLNYRIWKILKVFRTTDFQFGLKVGLGAFCISLLAFLPQTKVKFSEWRGEWSLVIYSIIMNKSLGGTSMTVKWRFIGTFLGAYGAYAIWTLCGGNVYTLAITGWLISIPSFYIILHWKTNNAFGRFILLTFNLTALYSYSMTQKDDEDGNEGGDNPIIGEIAFHRFVAVLFGTFFALFMAAVFLPNSARSRLKRGFTVLWLRMGIIWNSDPLSSRYDPETGDIVLIGLRDRRGTHEIISELETLLKQAPKEFRLKGKFPIEIYQNLLKSTSNIVDAFQNMSTMIDVDPKLTESEEFVLGYISNERSELEHRIFLIFYMIASALKLGFPLPSKPASTEHAKDRMLAKLNEIRSDEENTLLLTNEDYVLLYSYILVTSTIADELDKITEQIQELLGHVSQETFELS